MEKECLVCKKKSRNGEENPRWKGGITFLDGYKRIKVKGHPRANKLGYVFEHIIIAEQKLGCPLPKGSIVHHKDRNRANNNPDNLLICPSISYHRYLHARENKLLDQDSPDRGTLVSDTIISRALMEIAPTPATQINHRG
jgi:hypothetical protein